MAKVGGCLCGAVRYELSGEPMMTAVCHCTHCQKQSGAAFSVNLVAPEAALSITGDLTTFEDAGDSGNAVWRKFCGRCGSPILSALGAAPGIVALKAGTLDDPSGLSPQLETWCDSRQDWLTMDTGVPGFPANPPSGG